MNLALVVLSILVSGQIFHALPNQFDFKNSRFKDDPQDYSKTVMVIADYQKYLDKQFSIGGTNSRSERNIRNLTGFLDTNIHTFKETKELLTSIVEDAGLKNSTGLFINDSVIVILLVRLLESSILDVRFLSAEFLLNKCSTKAVQKEASLTS